VIERIQRYLTDPASASFEELALAVFAYQYANVEPYRRMCDGRGATPGTIADWRQVPLVPAEAFKRVRLAAAPPQEIFRSSGTTGAAAAGATGAAEAGNGIVAAEGDAGAASAPSDDAPPDGGRSVHYHPFPDLYRRTIDASFPMYCLPRTGGDLRFPMLSLVPSRAQLPDSSLSFMIDHVMTRFGAPDSVVACGKRGVEAVPARSWAAVQQRAGAPAVVLTTSLALSQWLDALERQDLRFRLPAGSAVFETGGFKGRAGEVSVARERVRLAQRLGVPSHAVVREYGMTELTSQCYTRVLLGSDPDHFVAPHWVRVRVLDPATLSEAKHGEPGLLAIFDLANLGSAAHLLTADMGEAEGEGFRLLGRAAGAELRGCSLTAEELFAAGDPGAAAG
jgi:Acyl-protein synthetase, LuxE